VSLSVLQLVMQDKGPHRCIRCVFTSTRVVARTSGYGCNAFHDSVRVFVFAEQCASRTWREGI